VTAVDTQTPDEWLLEKYDNTPSSQRKSGHVRPLFNIADDHPGDTCQAWASFPQRGTGQCRWWSGQASWPTPSGLMGMWMSPLDGDEFHHMMEAG
jgi:hypothetical protein